MEDTNSRSEQTLNEEINRFENPSLTEAERMEANERFNRWADGSMGRNGRLDDERLARFMEGKLGNMQDIMKRGEEMRSWNGHIRKVEPKQNEDMVSRKEYDELIQEIYDTTDFAARVDLMRQAEDKLMETNAVVPLYFYNDIYLQKPNVTGIYTSLNQNKYFMYAEKKAE